MQNYFQTFSTKICVKSLLMLLNLAFWVSGLALLCAGIELRKFIISNANSLESLSYVLVAIGVVVMVIGTLSCFCTVKSTDTLLYLYGGFLFLVIVLEISVAVSGISNNDRLAADFDYALNKSVEEYGPNNMQSASLDTMQSMVHCCGARNGPQDWGTKANPEPVPFSCCINRLDCNVQNDDYVYQDACYIKFVNFINSHLSRIRAIALGLGLFPLMSIVLTCALANNKNKLRYESMA